MKSQRKNQKNAEEQPSLGTKISEQERAKANRYSEEKRQELFEEGMAIIYGGAKDTKTSVNSR